MIHVNVCEVFESIQGESTYAGLTCFFIRLAGCNLRCRYCDTRHAYGEGRETAIADLVAQWRESSAAIAEVTGGEPLCQAGFRELAVALRDGTPKPVLVETNGSLDISAVPEGVVTILDVKCPGSGEVDSFDLVNLKRLRPPDEVKFVIGDEADYRWAVDFVKRHELNTRCHTVLFGPVHGVLAPGVLAGWILEGGAPVRLQVPLHKVLGVR